MASSWSRTFENVAKSSARLRPSVRITCVRRSSLLVEVPPEEIGHSASQIPVKGQPNFPGAHDTRMPEYVTFKPKDEFIAFRPRTPLTCIKDTALILRQNIDRMLGSYSAILYKNLPIKNGEDFNALVENLGYSSMDYTLGTANRERYLSSTYEASIEPPEVIMDLHNEMSYAPVFPDKILFSPVKVPNRGKECPYVFNREVQTILDPVFQEKAIRKGIRYIANYGDRNKTSYFTWQTALGTNCRKEAEKKLDQRGYSWQWKADGSIRTWFTQEALARHPVTKEKIWFNQIYQCHNSYYKSHPAYNGTLLPSQEYPLHTTYGDGEEIEDAFIQHCRIVTWKSAIVVPLECGDLMVLDNMLCQHGRMSYEGTRKMLVSLLEPRLRSQCLVRNEGTAQVL